MVCSTTPSPSAGTNKDWLKRRDPVILVQFQAFLQLERGLSANTLESYSRDRNRFLEYAEDEQLDMRTLQLSDFHHFTWQIADLGISERSIARMISSIRAFFRFLLLDGYIDENPTELLQTPNFGKHLPEVLTLEEVDRIIAAIDLSKCDGQRDRAIIEVLYSCGLRVSELCQLKLSDLFLEDGYITVYGKGNKQRLVPISSQATHELSLWFMDRKNIKPRSGEEDFVFISTRRRQHLSRITVFHNIRIYAELAGIQKNIGPHTFRHTFATHMLEGGANLRAIQMLLGHENIATTEIYAHLDTRFLREQVLRYFPRNQKEKDGSTPA